MLTLVVALNQVEARVIGSLAEKQLTTPQQYPLTLNALILACNQSSNRDPVVAYDDAVVETALASLKEAGLLRFVHPSHGRSAVRYRQVLDERYGLDARSLAIMAVLMLRGPQTVGELRGRTERMADFGRLDDVEAELERLAGAAEPLVRRLPRRPGQKEERWTQLLSDVSDEPSREPDPDAHVPDAGTESAAVESRSSDRLASLRAEVDSLREEVARLRAVVDEVRTAFDL